VKQSLKSIKQSTDYALTVEVGMPPSGGLVMASPQVKNGYLKIANELIEQFALLNLSKYEWRVLMAILRETYGWNQKSGVISWAGIAKTTNIKFPHVSRAKATLIERNIIIQDGNIAGFNKDYESWIQPKKLPVQVSRVTSSGNKKCRKKLPVQVTTVTSSGNKKLPVQVTHTNIEIQKDIIKDREGFEQTSLRGLNSQAWQDYEQYRRESKLKKLKPMSVKRQHKWLVDQGDEQVQQEIIDTTIRQGYHGLVGMRNGRKRNGPNGTAKENADKMLATLNKIN